ncbi:MAG: hypothetical protein ACI9OJ_004651, partial [Myxococcota bacterium]
MKNRLFRLAASLLICACATDPETVTTGDGDLDGQDESGLAAGKADGSSFSDCDLREVLSFVNAPGSTSQHLRDSGIHTRAANNIAAARSGIDQVVGNEDDTLFGSIRALDDVYYVGPVAFRQLVAAVTGRCGAIETEVIFSPQP